MSSSRRPAASGDSILASLERGPSAARTHRSWLIIGGTAAAVLTLMIAWLAYGNATSVRALPPSAIKRPAPPVDDGMLSQSLPLISIPAPQAAAIVDEPASPAHSAEPSSRPAMVMLPADERERAPVAALPKEERFSRPPPVARGIAAKPVAAPRQAARPSKPAVARPEVRTVASKKQNAPSPTASPEVDSDVALLSAILAHSPRHAAERARQESCQGKKCAAKPASQP